MPTLLIALLAAPVAAPQNTFIETRRMMPDAPGAVALAGDTDGDGFADAVIAGEDGARLLRNAGWGLLVEAPGAIPALTDVVTAGELVDLDDDGDLDLFLGNAVAPSRVLANQGGSFLAATELRTGASEVLGSSHGDVDGDGDRDLVTVGDGRRLFRNTGGLSFALEPDFLGPSPQGNDLELGDVDGDGDLDIVLAPQETWINDGTGAFVLQAGSISGRSLSLFDYDADGDLDAAASIGDSSQSDRLVQNDGFGTFAPATLPPADGSNSHVFADLDLDGLGDLVTFPGSGPVARRGVGGGLLVDVTSEWISAENPPGIGGVAAADMDGDLDLDVVLANPRTSELVLNDGGFLAALHRPLEEVGLAFDLAHGDVDGDGREDLISVGSIELPRLLL